ncbi:hypothetical protein I316_01724 [Kwoniella heveanensis BCC8398]|uniref:Pal1 cell morphology protein n=1 Tax=Kwoniella heveanensis BCC8398 TaxID=1296120 RepID=A0A1B9GZN4_9TREE|nr:hypothetical protein I316_01724 [Kwoniella heveanensis BCC8398]
MAPPLPPPKDHHSYSSSSYLSPPSSTSSFNYINQDLAEAVRDSVQIKTPLRDSQQQQQRARPVSHYSNTRGSAPGASILLDTSSNNNNTSSTRSGNGPPLPSLDPLVPRRTPSPNPPNANAEQRMSSVFQPTHGYSQSSPDMSSIAQQPALPSARMSQLAVSNPFEEDEIEPAGTGRIKPPNGHNANNKSIGGLGLEGDGLVQPTRTKFTRSHTGAAPSTSSSAGLLGPTSPVSGGTKTRTRRSMSSDSYGFNQQDHTAMRELTAGQKKALEDKKGSRHADVIDTWDPTGLGTAMWHHSGPYDAAAPSRNTNLPTSKAPMQAFHPPPVQSPPRTGPTTISLSSPPVPPAKDIPTDGAERVPHRRAPSGNKHGIPANTRRVSGGGLTGQYSTSMPASGGYFPAMSDEPTDEAELMRRERQREREAKRQALKAAWGIDTPEPYEDFGGSPHEGMPARSPGLRFGMGATSPPIREDATSPTHENPPHARSGQLGPGGVKRTKSLMQKIKTMRENPNLAGRSSSPRGVSPTTDTGLAGSPSSELPPDLEKTKKPGFFSRSSGRSSPSKRPGASTGHSSTTSISGQAGTGSGSNTSGLASGAGSGTALATIPSQSQNENAAGVDMYEDAPEQLVPSGSGSGFVLVESPNSKARAMRALKKEQEAAAGHHHHHHRSNSNSQAQNGVPAVPANRAKYLPQPPIAPVIPDFDDILPQRRPSPLDVSQQERNEGGGGSGSGGLSVSRGDEGLKRKTSMVKKLRDKIAK